MNEPLSDAGLAAFLGAARAGDATWHSLIADLLKIRQFKDDWDGQGTPAPGTPLADAALGLARRLQAEGVVPASRVVAGMNGTIVFEWHTPSGYADIDVISPVEAEWLVMGAIPLTDSPPCVPTATQELTDAALDHVVGGAAAGPLLLSAGFGLAGLLLTWWMGRKTQKTQRMVQAVQSPGGAVPTAGS